MYCYMTAAEQFHRTVETPDKAFEGADAHQDARIAGLLNGREIACAEKWEVR